MRHYISHNIINAIFTSLNIYLIINIISQILLNINSYNWDNSENMYFASRILYGEFPGIREFYDKFFLVPFLFTLSSYYKSVNSWIAINVIVSVLASGALSATIVQLVQNYSNKTIFISIKYFLALFYLYLLSSIQGEFIYINPLAASFYIFFIYFIITSETRFKYSIRISHFRFILASLCSTIAISIRPYYLFAVLFIIFWRILYYKSNFSKRNYDFSFQKLFLNLFTTYIYYIFLLGLFFIIFNIFPYILIYSFESLFISSRMLLLDLKPQIYIETIYNQLLFFESLDISVQFFLLVVISALLFLIIFTKNMSHIFNVKSKNVNILLVDIICISIVPMILLEIMILSKHYWPHYMQLFIPNIVILCGLILCFSAQISILTNIQNYFLIIANFCDRKIYTSIYQIQIAKSVYQNINMKKMLKICFYSFPILWMSVQEVSNHIYISNIDRIINNKAEFILLNNIEKIRNDRRTAGFSGDFLYTSNMFSHWMLNESRHGFPHASHFSAISQGWFSNWNPRSVMPGFPTTTDSLCRKITLSGPSIVLVPKNSALFECMSSRPPVNYSINDIFYDYDGPVAVMFRDISY